MPQPASQPGTALPKLPPITTLITRPVNSRTSSQQRLYCCAAPVLQAPQLYEELLADLRRGTRLVAVNIEGSHFRFRSCLDAELDPAVKADSDAILVLDKTLCGAAASWQRAHSFPQLPQASGVRAGVRGGGEGCVV